MTRIFSTLCSFAFSCLSVSSQNLTAVSMRVPFVPVPMVVDGKQTIYYELHLTNFAKDSFQLKKLEVLNAADSAVLLTIDSLQKCFAGGVQSSQAVLAPGASGVLYIEMNLPVGKRITGIIHYLSFDHNEVRGAAIKLIPQRPLVIGAPLRDGPWWAVYNPLWERGHRRVLYVVDGQVRIPGRYAIDFIKLDRQGKYADVNEDDVKNWYGYGAAVIAVADGEVASVRNTFQESSTVSGHVNPSPEDATGNYVSIKIGEGRVAFYEHLQPGSIKVRPGQKVRKGEVIGALGFTGQTTGPHLHFHVANADSPLGAEGVPFVFEKFVLADLRTIAGERPVAGDTIRFAQ